MHPEDLRNLAFTLDRQRHTAPCTHNLSSFPSQQRLASKARNGFTAHSALIALGWVAVVIATGFSGLFSLALLAGLTAAATLVELYLWHRTIRRAGKGVRFLRPWLGYCGIAVTGFGLAAGFYLVQQIIWELTR